jgi:DtxR family Mn-dependent transcriptional regulator
MVRERRQEEYLENLWYMKEKRQDSIDVLKGIMKSEFSIDIVDELSAEGMVELRNGGSNISFTARGEESARRLIRSHRLAERMVHDILGGEFEAGACEFEHIITPELVDSICTLLGHPRECPHGMPIPEGKCCKVSARVAGSSVIPLTELEIRQTARVAYINCMTDQRLHKMEGLQIRPGTMIKLHQTYPAFVIECEGAHIALDTSVASNICVWKPPQHDNPPDNLSPDEKKPVNKRRGRKGRLRFGRK